VYKGLADRGGRWESPILVQDYSCVAWNRVPHFTRRQRKHFSRVVNKSFGYYKKRLSQFWRAICRDDGQSRVIGVRIVTSLNRASRTDAMLNDLSLLDTRRLLNQGS